MKRFLVTDKVTDSDGRTVGRTDRAGQARQALKRKREKPGKSHGLPF